MSFVMPPPIDPFLWGSIAMDVAIASRADHDGFCRDKPVEADEVRQLSGSTDGETVEVVGM